MKIGVFQEPVLEFGRGEHICPRAGITMYDVVDVHAVTRRHTIRLGAVGTKNALDRLSVWLDRCSRAIASEPDIKQPNLYPSFCGFNEHTGFMASLKFEAHNARSLRATTIRRIGKIIDRGRQCVECVELFSDHIEFLARNGGVDLIVCILPGELDALLDEEGAGDELLDNEADDDDVHFGDALKAKSLHLAVPLHLVREVALDSRVNATRGGATQAWDFCTALYSKVNGTVPWRLMQAYYTPPVCYASIGFHIDRNRKRPVTSFAQMVDGYGTNSILCGTTARVNTVDSRPRLTGQQAHDLLRRALYTYLYSMRVRTDRVVIHKSVNYSTEELEGFRTAAGALGINAVDFVIVRDSKLRLLRNGAYPPYRGTYIQLEPDLLLLYTKGFVAHYNTYPGRNVPQPLEIKIVASGESPNNICSEILGLTKMNWRTTQFDGKYPVTLASSRQASQVMRYLRHEDIPPVLYSTSM